MFEHPLVRRVAADGLGWRVVECSSVSHALGHVHDRAPVPFAEAVVVWSVVRAKLLDDRRVLAVVAVVVGDPIVRMFQVLVVDVRSPPPP